MFPEGDRRPPTRRGLIDLFPTVPPREVAQAAAPPPDPFPPPERAGYESFYGFAWNPFAARPDLRFLYLTESFDRARDAVRRALVEQHGVVVVSGERGTGKTLLCLAVETEVAATTPMSFMAAPPQSAIALLDTLLVDFGVAARSAASHRLERSDRDRLLGALRSFLASLAGLNTRAVVVIDDAHTLPLDVLDQLSELVTFEESIAALHLVLVGAPVLRARLGIPELRMLHERVTESVTLTALTLDEVGGYVVHRLSAAAANARVEFTARALDSVYMASGGNPAVVNAVCNAALLRASERAASVIDDEAVAAAAADLDLEDPAPPHREITAAIALAILLAICVVGGALGAVWVFRGRLADGVASWERVPTPPSGPVLRQPVPLRALPPPDSAESFNQSRPD